MDALQLDWRVSMKQARAVLGEEIVICGNIDPVTLYGSEEKIKQSVEQCMRDAGR
jgi:uroporphyrinogen decarboxylase